MLTAIGLGSAACLHEDMAAALELFTPDLVVACNDAGADHPGPLDHWVSFHCEFFPKWVARREAKGYPPAGQLWTVKRRHQPTQVQALDVQTIDNWGGSSGLLVAQVASLFAQRVVLCGVPLDAKQGHYNDPKPWRDAGNYRANLLSHLPDLGNVRSMSGWTRETLGAPTKEWFNP